MRVIATASDTIQPSSLAVRRSSVRPIPESSKNCRRRYSYLGLMRRTWASGSPVLLPRCPAGFSEPGVGESDIEYIDRSNKEKLLRAATKPVDPCGLLFAC
jgi:hypothetical protein